MNDTLFSRVQRGELFVLDNPARSLIMKGGDSTLADIDLQTDFMTRINPATRVLVITDPEEKWEAQEVLGKW